MNRADVVAQARTWLGTPYHHQARLKGKGVDCAGLVICVARELGMVPPDFDVPPYPRQPDGRSMLAHCDAFMTRIDLVDMAAGDVIVLRFEQDPQHMGIVAPHRSGCLSMVHALGTADGKGRVIEQRLDSSTIERFVAAYRMPGVPA
jgi:cell wall-associated NlpC family hydrolase